jgi:glycosyltransferase involved in cell wall biosynthesis
LDVAYVNRVHAQRTLRVEYERSKPDAVLHLGVPYALAEVLSSGRHYLYCDSTWHMRCEQVSFLHPLIRGRLRAHRTVDARLGRSFAAFAHIFCASAAARDDFVQHYRIPASRVSVVGTGLGGKAPAFVPKDPSPKTVLFVARHEFARKGGPLLLQGFRLALDKDPELRLVVVGPLVLLEAQVRGAPNVVVTGFLERSDLDRLFQESALYAMPAPWEPWGLVYLEALAAGTPVLGLRKYGLIDITRNGSHGFLVDDPTPSAVAAAILDAFSDPARLAEMGRSGREHCLRRYTWENVASAMLSVMNARDVAREEQSR